MTARQTRLPVLLVLFFLVSSCTAGVKEPAVAGSFYPADERQLRMTVSSFLETAEIKPYEGRLVALMSPHAGYSYSGQVAAYGYRQLKGRDIRTVILIGPSHHYPFSGAAIYARGGMRTPLGVVRIDEARARELVNDAAGVSVIEEAFAKEHSLEVQLPFLQQTLKNFKIVPVLVGSPTKESFDHLTRKLADLIRRDKSAIIVVSTDLSHYHDYDTAVSMDKKVIEAAERLAIDDLERLLSTREGEMCGGYPVIYALAAAREAGATNGILYRYANSGDVTGSPGSVVGYASMGIYRSGLTAEEKGLLLSIARKTIVDFITTGKVPDPGAVPPRLKAAGATFVTINRGGALRGCIGNMMPAMPLFRSVVTNAVAASSRDHRFPPMRIEELADMEVEVSVLSPFEEIGDISEIRIGTHGLYLVKDGRTAVFLPQVPAEQGWDVPAYLENLARKAGLPPDGWKGARLYVFTAEVIREKAL